MGSLWREDFIWAGLVAIFFAGVLSNWLVLRTNGWRMPVSRAVHASDKVHVTMAPHHRFPLLADIIPIGTVRASIGDLLVVVAMFGMFFWLATMLK